jgi:tRNA modification GTPase
MNGDTVAAISTPVGEGGIGIVRLSGPDAVRVVDSVFRSSRGCLLQDAESHTLQYGRIVQGANPVDEVLVAVMRAPRTYTREDVVEINCHGGIVATRAVLDLVLASGARLAERGEFTKRAYLNGRISLDQAKAVLDIVRARTRLGLEAAVDRLGGRFTQAMEALRSSLLSVLAELEVQLDYPDLEVEFDAIAPRVEACAAHVKEMLDRSSAGRLIREGLTVVIVGRPNVGKSTLLNALLSEERAIVTPVPGTTRDTIEEHASLEGVPIRWVDTAGLREAEHPVEREGVRRTRAAMERADLWLLMVDTSEPKTVDDVQLMESMTETPVVLVLSKADLPDQWAEVPEGSWVATVRLSAKTGQGMDDLKQVLLDALLSGRLPTRNAVLLLDTWERDLLRRVQERLAGALDVVNGSSQADLVAEELRRAYSIASELQGIDVSETLVDAIFSRFCVGK